MPSSSRIPVLLIVLLTCICWIAPCKASVADAAAKVKAGYLLNFIKFSSWSPEAFAGRNEKAPIVIAVLGEGAANVAEILEALVDGKTIQERSVAVRRYSYPHNDDSRRQQEELATLFEELSDAHCIYIDSSLHDEVRDVLERVREEHVLTVSDSHGFASQGGMLGLVLDDDRIIFEANTDAIDKSHVKVSSKILRLARVVRERGS